MPLARCQKCMAAGRRDDIHRTDACPYEVDQHGQRAESGNNLDADRTPSELPVGWNEDRTLFIDPTDGTAYTERELVEMDRDAYDRLRARVEAWEAEHGK